MAGYTELLRRLEEHRQDVGLFRKVVLHSHSPDSPDYGRTFAASGTDCKGMHAKSEQEYLAELVKSNLDMVAITDHMKCGLACRASDTLTSSSICVLPGMEINIRPSPPLNAFRIHILGIFPEKLPHERICRILPQYIPEEKSRVGNEEIKEIGQIKDFVDVIHNCGGICIAAHIDTDRGARRTFRQLGRDGITFCAPNGELSTGEEKRISELFKDWILSAGFDGIEVAKSSDKEHYCWVSEITGRKTSIAVLLKGDAHCIEDLDSQERVTYIKMASVCFEDLVQALRFAETRIRFPSDVPAKPCPRILGMEIVAGSESGFFENIGVAFSDNLTCMIGPRGSGKSTIIESLRYMFDQNKHLNEMEKAGAELAAKARSLQRATLTDCVMRLVYVAEDGEHHILESIFDNKQDCTTRVYDANGNVREIHNIETNYPVRLFGWSEIETLGREAGRQRELLDRLIPEFQQASEKRDEVRLMIRGKRAEIAAAVTKLETVMGRNGGEIKRYKEYQSDFDKLNTVEIKDLFRDIDIAKAKESILKKIDGDLQDWLNKLSERVEIDIIPGIDELSKELKDVLNDWWDKSPRRDQLKGKISEATKHFEAGMQMLRTISGELQSEIRTVNEELQGKEKDLRDRIGEEATKQTAAELRRLADERLRQATGLRREYIEAWSEFEALLAEWKGIAHTLQDIQGEISERRLKRKEEIESELNKFSTPEMEISLRFRQGQDREKFIAHLYSSGIFSGDLHGHWRANLWPERFSLSCSPIEMAEALLAKEHTKLVSSFTINGQEMGVDEGMAEGITSTTFPFAHDSDADVPIIDKVKLGKILHMAETEWDDDEGILLNGRAVEGLSPGQRSSAMLPLIVLVEDIPLIIDQPEDNLDNRLVGKMLVDILKNLKEKRQIIVATHNPNIVVSGDAEQVIVLDALSDSRGILRERGCIDKEAIVRAVIEIMEGGEEAFITRAKRYGLES